MSEELSPEQIAEIRADLTGRNPETTYVDAATALALCDTADALRGQITRACMQIGDHRAELETLRGIARHLGQGYSPLAHARAWVRHEPVHGFHSMTPAEVQAIYGTGKETASNDETGD